MDMSNQRFELVFGTLRSKVSNLRLEAADKVGGGVGNASAKLENCFWPTFEMRRKLRRVGVQADTEQRIVFYPGGVERFDEAHAFFAGESFNVTVRLNTGAPSFESKRSATK